MLLTFIVVIASLVVIVIVGVLALDRYLSGRPQNLDARPRAEAMQNGRELLLPRSGLVRRPLPGRSRRRRRTATALAAVPFVPRPARGVVEFFAGQAERYGLDVHGARLEWCAR
ncbi:hypothetical protein [Microbacterium oryzae]|uniref:hypothetical protein n=1 Tax=Microbacterium oryzae TaxID=743009 RepID=UPI0012E30190|nr:hypothetical protein [Microbacterium oryzae]